MAAEAELELGQGLRPTPGPERQAVSVPEAEEQEEETVRAGQPEAGGRLALVEGLEEPRVPVVKEDRLLEGRCLSGRGEA